MKDVEDFIDYHANRLGISREEYIAYHSNLNHAVGGVIAESIKEYDGARKSYEEDLIINIGNKFPGGNKSWKKWYADHRTFSCTHYCWKNIRTSNNE